MHTPHFIVVKAKAGKKACEIVDKHLEGWGGEVNWYTVCGAVSENDEVHCLGQGRYAPNEIAVTSVKQINSGLKGRAAALRKDKKASKGKKVVFNALEHEWNSGDYTEVGVTRIKGKDETGKL